MKLKSWQLITLFWLVWASLLNGFQVFTTRRLALARPDPVLDRTAQFSNQAFLDSLPALGGFWEYYSDPHVAWDSNYYLSIATGGYEDPHMPVLTTRLGAGLSRNYAFLPLYPLLARLAAAPMRWLWAEREAVIWGAIVVALLGALAGALALADLAGGEEDGRRAAFYLLVFPTAFFFSQVYSEGLFTGLAFGCLALVARRQWLGAGLLASAACLTRTAGAGLVLAMAAGVIVDAHQARQRGELSRGQLAWQTAGLLLPLVTLAVWSLSPFGEKFFIVQDAYFHRKTFALAESWASWSAALRGYFDGSLPAVRQAYFSLEFGSVALALVAGLATLRRCLPAAVFSLFILVASVLSGYPQSMARYMLTVPSIYLFLSPLGRNRLFDRGWTLFSVLLLGALLTLFTFDLWVG